MAEDGKNTKKTGDLGEEIACRYLRSKGFSIVERNYSRKWGEIDIVARGTSLVSDRSGVSHGTSERVHFIEVKSVSYETKAILDWTVSHETWRPEELVHNFKLNQIRKTLETWVAEHHWTGDVQIDVIAVRMVTREKYATVKYIPHVIIE